jgi:hypothetical protein
LILKETIQPRDLVLDLARLARNSLLLDDAGKIPDRLFGRDRQASGCLAAKSSAGCGRSGRSGNAPWRRITGSQTSVVQPKRRRNTC